MEHLLDPEDLDNLFALLRRASKHWKDIGRHLGFTISELDKITTKTGVSQIDHYFQELLDMWLDRASSRAAVSVHRRPCQGTPRGQISPHGIRLGKFEGLYGRQKASREGR